MEKWPIGVFTSIGAGLGAGLEAVKELGVPTVHKTVGLVPSEKRAERVAITKQISDFSKVVGCDALGMHIGAVPEDAQDPVYGEVVGIAQEVCDHCKANGQRFHLETGQESVDTLLRFFGDVGRDNLAINFDPANLILYGVAEPIEALKRCGQYVKSCHCKDAKWAAKPGEEWGEEMALGQGEVGMANFIQTLKDIGYEGPLTIEREISGDQQKKDIAEAVKLLERLRAEILQA